jgi:hypothetical protein
LPVSSVVISTTLLECADHTLEMQGPVPRSGRLLASPGTDDQGRVRAPVSAEQVLLYAGARVPRWEGVPVPRDMDQVEWEAFVGEQA